MDGYIQTIRDARGFALLCPFHITGPDDCATHHGNEEGYVVEADEDVIVVCDPFRYGFDLESSCHIDCPGRHFTVRSGGKLTLDRMILSGSTDSSIKVQSTGHIVAINTIFEK